jgi:hypothetical protein
VSVIAKFEGGQTTKIEGRVASWVRAGAPVVPAS